MNDYLGNLLSRTFNQVEVLQPLRKSRFESSESTMEEDVTTDFTRVNRNSAMEPAAARQNTLEPSAVQQNTLEPSAVQQNTLEAVRQQKSSHQVDKLASIGQAIENRPSQLGNNGPEKLSPSISRQEASYPKNSLQDIQQQEESITIESREIKNKKKSLVLPLQEASTAIEHRNDSNSEKSPLGRVSEGEPITRSKLNTLNALQEDQSRAAERAIDLKNNQTQSEVQNFDSQKIFEKQSSLDQRGKAEGQMLQKNKLQKHLPEDVPLKPLQPKWDSIGLQEQPTLSEIPLTPIRAKVATEKIEGQGVLSERAKTLVQNPMAMQDKVMQTNQFRSEPTIQVNIGKIEVGAAPATPVHREVAPRPQPVSAAPALSLDAYLTQRGKRGR